MAADLSGFMPSFLEDFPFDTNTLLTAACSALPAIATWAVARRQLRADDLRHKQQLEQQAEKLTNCQVTIADLVEGTQRLTDTLLASGRMLDLSSTQASINHLKQQIEACIEESGQVAAAVHKRAVYLSKLKSYIAVQQQYVDSFDQDKLQQECQRLEHEVKNLEEGTVLLQARILEAQHKLEQCSVAELEVVRNRLERQLQSAQALQLQNDARAAELARYNLQELERESHALDEQLRYQMGLAEDIAHKRAAAAQFELQEHQREHNELSRKIETASELAVQVMSLQKAAEAVDIGSLQRVLQHKEERLALLRQEREHLTQQLCSVDESISQYDVQSLQTEYHELHARLQAAKALEAEVTRLAVELGALCLENLERDKHERIALLAKARRMEAEVREFSKVLDIVDTKELEELHRSTRERLHEQRQKHEQIQQMKLELAALTQRAEAVDLEELQAHRAKLLGELTAAEAVQEEVASLEQQILLCNPAALQNRRTELLAKITSANAYKQDNESLEASLQDFDLAGLHEKNRRLADELSKAQALEADFAQRSAELGMSYDAFLEQVSTMRIKHAELLEAQALQKEVLSLQKEVAHYDSIEQLQLQRSTYQEVLDAKAHQDQEKDIRPYGSPYVPGLDSSASKSVASSAATPTTAVLALSHTPQSDAFQASQQRRLQLEELVGSCRAGTPRPGQHSPSRSESRLSRRMSAGRAAHQVDTVSAVSLDSKLYTEHQGILQGAQSQDVSLPVRLHLPTGDAGVRQSDEGSLQSLDGVLPEDKWHDLAVCTHKYLKELKIQELQGMFDSTPGGDDTFQTPGQAPLTPVAGGGNDHVQLTDQAVRALDFDAVAVKDPTNPMGDGGTPYSTPLQSTPHFGQR